MLLLLKKGEPVMAAGAEAGPDNDDEDEEEEEGKGVATKGVAAAPERDGAMLDAICHAVANTQNRAGVHATASAPAARISAQWQNC